MLQNKLGLYMKALCFFCIGIDLQSLLRRFDNVDDKNKLNCPGFVKKRLCTHRLCPVIAG